MQERIAGDCVDACRAEVLTAVRARRFEVCSDLELELHRSISHLLHGQIYSLTHHNPNLRILPDDLHASVGRWKANADPRDFEGFVRLRAEQWRASLIEMLERLAQDWPCLIRAFDLPADNGIASISEPLGDPHNDGRSVYKVTFHNGRAIIYKPRPVGTEHIFYRLVEWLNTQEHGPQLRACRALPCAGYGWTDFVTPQCCQTVDEGVAYYERQGAFLALFFLINGSDCISENVVGDVDHPVWVDTECICRPVFVGAQKISVAPEWMSDSIIGTSFAYSPNQVGLPPRATTGLSISCFEDRVAAFTDNDVLREPFISAVKVGFRRTYECILSRTSLWSVGTEPLCWLRDQQVRVVFRATMLYSALMKSLLLSPEQDALSTRQTVQELLRERLGHLPSCDEIVNLEMSAFDRGDIPYWFGSTSSHGMKEAVGRPVTAVFAQSGMEALDARIAAVSAAELKNQLWIIDTYLRLPNAA